MQTKNILNIHHNLRIASLAILLALLAPIHPVQARTAPQPVQQAGSAMDLINAVNDLRAQFGLAPYSVDSTLMSLAQDQSEYQAAIQACTHTRADGSGPGDHGISAENVACGSNLSVQGAVSGQWTDALHNATMVGPTTGEVGAGVASNGGSVYYTLAVRRGSGEFIARSLPSNSSSTGQNVNTSASTTNSNNSPAQQVSNGIVTNTPNADGSVSHIVHYGETLVGIAEAYGVPLNELIGINHLDPKNPAIYERQPLLIRLAFTPTVYVTPTNTLRPPTRTPGPTRTPRPTRTATVFYTPEPSITPTPTPVFRVPTLEELGPGRNVLAYTFIAISVLGLIVLALTSFGPRRGS